MWGAVETVLVLQHEYIGMLTRCIIDFKLIVYLPIAFTTQAR